MKKFLKDIWCCIFHPRILICVDSPWFVEKCEKCNKEEVYCIGY